MFAPPIRTPIQEKTPEMTEVFEVFGEGINDVFYTKLWYYSQNKPKKDARVYVIPMDTVVLNAGKICDDVPGSNTSKNLISCPVRHPCGCTNLRPITSRIWKPLVSQSGYLKQIHTDNQKCMLAFECEWPIYAQEFVTRNRPHGWPTVNVIESIIANGAKVVPKCPDAIPDETYDADIDWRYCFLSAEHTLGTEAMSTAQLDCFRIVKRMVDELQVEDVITYYLLRHVFFYLCEETDVGLWETEPGQCVIRFLGKLSGGLGQKRFPNYFAKTQSTFGESVSDERIQICIDRILAVRMHPFLWVYMSVEPGFNSSVDLEHMLNKTANDAVVYETDIKTVERCFLNIIVNTANSLTLSEAYTRCCELCITLVKACNTFLEQPLCHEDTLLLQILSNITCIHRQWFLALNIDLGKGRRLTHELYVGCGNVRKLCDIYGDEFAHYLRKTRNANADVLIPAHLCNPYLVCYITDGLVKVLKSLNTPTSVISNLLYNYFQCIVPTLVNSIPFMELSERQEMALQSSFKLLVAEVIVTVSQEKLEAMMHTVATLKQRLASERNKSVQTMLRTLDTLTTSYGEATSSVCSEVAPYDNTPGQDQ